MSDVIAIVPEPKTLCKACVENARHQNETFGLVWCEHSKYGGIYQTEIGLWAISGPFADEACFKRSLYHSFARKLMSKAT